MNSRATRSLTAVLDSSNEGGAPDSNQTPEANPPSSVKPLDALPLALPPRCFTQQSRSFILFGF